MSALTKWNENSPFGECFCSHNVCRHSGWLLMACWYFYPVPSGSGGKIRSVHFYRWCKRLNGPMMFFYRFKQSKIFAFNHSQNCRQILFFLHFYFIFGVFLTTVSEARQIHALRSNCRTENGAKYARIVQKSEDHNQELVMMTILQGPTANGQSEKNEKKVKCRRRRPTIITSSNK